MPEAPSLCCSENTGCRKWLRNRSDPSWYGGVDTHKQKGRNNCAITRCDHATTNKVTKPRMLCKRGTRATLSDWDLSESFSKDHTGDQKDEGRRASFVGGAGSISGRGGRAWMKGWKGLGSCGRLCGRTEWPEPGGYEIGRWNSRAQHMWGFVDHSEDYGFYARHSESHQGSFLLNPHLLM